MKLWVPLIGIVLTGAAFWWRYTHPVVTEAFATMAVVGVEHQKVRLDHYADLLLEARNLRASS